MRKMEIIIGIIGLLCLVYGVFVYRVQSGTYTFILWLALGVLFLLIKPGQGTRLLCVKIFCVEIVVDIL